MSLWMIRAGRHGEFEDRFLSISRIYLTWGDTFPADARGAASRAEIVQTLRDRWPNVSEGKVRNHAGQVWAFLRTMKPEDLVVVPSKKTPELHFGVIRSDTEFDPSAEPDYRHSHEVTWLRDLPRSSRNDRVGPDLNVVESPPRRARDAPRPRPTPTQG